MPEEELQRISLFIEKDTYKAIQQLKVDGAAKNSTVFIRDAIQEKLDRAKANPQSESLMNLFNSLNDEGKRWLIQCATIAAGNSITRNIRERGSGESA